MDKWDLCQVLRNACSCPVTLEDLEFGNAVELARAVQPSS